MGSGLAAFPGGKPVRTVIGVDFSGAALSGKTAWLAELQALDLADEGGPPKPRFRLTELKPLGRLAGADDRDTVNAYLVDRISAARETFWGCDFPFGLPIDLPLGDWQDQLSLVSRFDGNAKEFGHYLVNLTMEHLGTKHVRRVTDKETQTPFDCYHYRIIYQTFHGMRDVLAPLASVGGVAVLPFQYAGLSRAATSLVVEACPASTLKRLGLPHQRFKQSGGKPPTSQHQATRRVILKRLTEDVELSPYRRSVIMRDPGGDALDAVLAGLGAWMGYVRADHRAIKRHPRYPREGMVYC